MRKLTIIPLEVKFVDKVPKELRKIRKEYEKVVQLVEYRYLSEKSLDEYIASFPYKKMKDSVVQAILINMKEFLKTLGLSKYVEKISFEFVPVLSNGGEVKIRYYIEWRKS